jgi:hypothetical protein
VDAAFEAACKPRLDELRFEVAAIAQRRSELAPVVGELVPEIPRGGFFNPSRR